MKPGLIFAISASLILIGGATWSRYSGDSFSKSDLLTVEQTVERAQLSQDLYQDFYQPNAEGDVPSEPLSNTDLISRQLMMDYLNLASNGGAGTETIDALAQQYAESIPTINSPEKVSYLDIKLVAGTRADFQTYSTDLSRIYSTHSQAMKNAAGKINRAQVEAGNFSFAQGMGKVYENTASELRKISVPKTMANIHVQLINNHLSSASAADAILQIESDPMKSMAGLIAISENAEIEVELIKTMSQIINANAI